MHQRQGSLKSLQLQGKIVIFSANGIKVILPQSKHLQDPSGGSLTPHTNPWALHRASRAQLFSPCWQRWMSGKGSPKLPCPRRSRQPVRGPAAGPPPCPTCSPVAARHHLFTVDDDKRLQGLPCEAAACLAAVCVPARAPYTHVLSQGGTKVRGVTLRERDLSHV